MGKNFYEGYQSSICIIWIIPASIAFGHPNTDLSGIFLKPLRAWDYPNNRNTGDGSIRGRFCDWPCFTFGEVKSKFLWCKKSITLTDFVFIKRIKISGSSVITLNRIPRFFRRFINKHLRRINIATLNSFKIGAVSVGYFLLTVFVASGILCLEVVSLRVDSLESTPLDAVSFLYSNFVGASIRGLSIRG